MFPFSNLPKAGRGRRMNRGTHGDLESLEGRQLLSASTSAIAFWPIGRPLNSIQFSLAPAAVQTGLSTLATSDGLTDPTATTEVSLGNRDGVETYSVTISSTGTVSKLTVDAAGNPVTAPTKTTTTFGALASAPAAEITAIATAKSLTAPASDTVVNVTTPSAGAVTYSIALSGDGTAVPVTSTAAASDASWGGPPTHGFAVMVDAAGNPVGNQQLPFSVFSTTIQSALNAGAPTGATALDATSTQTVSVRTSDGVTTYSTRFTVSGTTTTVTVNSAGATVTPASKTTADFNTIPAAAQTELQTLATTEGYTGTIATTQSVTVYTEIGGATTLYGVTLSVTSTTTTSTTNSGTHEMTFVVDSAGNPTVTAMDLGGPGAIGGGPGLGGPGFGGPGGGVFHGGGGHGWGDHGGHHAPPPGGSDDGGSSSGSTGSGTVTSSKATASSSLASKVSGDVLATIAAADLPTAPTLGASIALFGSALTNVTVLADLVQLRSDAATLRSTVKGLSKTDTATLRADEKAIAKAIKAMSSTLTPAKNALKADGKKYAATLKADQKAIRKAGSNATVLSAAEATLATDKAAAFTALSADLDALKSLINADAGVTTARAKLATDLPTVSTAQDTVVSDYTQLQTDIGTALTDAASA